MFSPSDSIASGDAGDARQSSVADAMVTSGRERGEILGELAISEEEFLGWIRDGDFPSHVARLARRWAQAQAPYVWLELLRLTKDGSVPAIRLYFDLWSRKTSAPVSGDGAKSPSTPSAELDALRCDIFGEP